MVLSSDLGLQWRWAHNQSAFCKLAQHLQDFFLISGVPLPLDISQRFLTHMQLLGLLCQVSKFSVFSTRHTPLCLKSLPLLAHLSRTRTNYAVDHFSGRNSLRKPELAWFVGKVKS